MTTNVNVEAHCGADEVVKVTQTNAAPVYLRDGEVHTTHAFDNVIVRVQEIPVSEAPADALSPVGADATPAATGEQDTTGTEDGGGASDPAAAGGEGGEGDAGTADPGTDGNDATQQQDATAQA